ncbi:MAG TPA: hypothetical protein VKY85_07805 [Candidatus Angelobacter sp.]|nr:hypothetical protein [Candidatus Angelobacter sp.]
MLRTRSKSACETHARHASYEAAQMEVCRQFEEHHIRLVVFPSSKKKACKCGGWHTGHLRKAIKAAEKAK